MAVAAAFLAGELLLPGVAENRLRADLERRGTVERVEVEAFPALKLLFGGADRVTVAMGEVRTASGRVADELVRTRGTERVDATARIVRIGPLTLRRARFEKRGARLHGEGEVGEAELAAALPLDIGLRPVSSDGGTLVLEATAPVFGQEVAVRARLSAREGALVVAPDGLLSGFATLTVFRDERVHVSGVGARPTADGFVLEADGRL